MTQPAANKQCGDCAMCCKVLEIHEIAKARHTMCGHFRKGGGCSIYETRPTACRQFVCAWLTTPDMDASWRPDRSKLMLWGSGQLMVDVDPAYPDAWKREPYYSKLKQASDRRRPGAVDVVVRNGREVFVLFPEGAVSLGPEQEAPIRSGYRAGKPFAEYVRELG
ncbi:MAG TPA: YkgJ family cysteine cluster protein [Caulobacteraceae bacterium]|nr:YkgJ family cysteine cluster protein [Caulobacteraceae bacterium]